MPHFELEKSIREQVYTLPDETQVYSGHGEVTSVGEEKEGKVKRKEEEGTGRGEKKR